MKKLIKFKSHCIGNPTPHLTWWRGPLLIDHSYYTTAKGIIRNILTFQRLTRDDLMMVLTCQATNTNLTDPASQTIAVDLNCKFIYFHVCL